MSEALSSRQRMLLAMTNQQPDRVPVAPDISNMVPCRLTGKPFWDIYLNQNPPLWQAYLDAVKYFGIDGWFIYAHLEFQTKPRCAVTDEVVFQDDQRILMRYTFHTPAGDLVSEVEFPRDMPPRATKRLMTNFVEDFEKFKYTYDEVLGYRNDAFQAMRHTVGELGVVSLNTWMPGFHAWHDTIEGTLEALTLAYHDFPGLFEEWRQLEHARCLRQLDMCIDAKPDFILFGASGLLTLQSPTIFRHLSLPTLQEGTRRCKQAGIPTMLHACGKERYLVEVFANETDLDCVNPLEMPPMGDCDLREVKASFGHRLALMGNLHTTETMWRGTPAQVEQACLEALAAAKGEGGFILSTGDQCGRDTPDANIFKMVEVGKRAGRYS